MASSRAIVCIARRSKAPISRCTRRAAHPVRYMETDAFNKDVEKKISNRPTRRSGVLNDGKEERKSASMPNFYGWIDAPLNIPVIQPTPPPHGRLVCTVQLSSHMPDHLDFISYFAIHSAKAMGIPATQSIIHLPTDWKKWNLIKSPFIFAKTKEILEEKVYHRAVQIFDVDRSTVKGWVRYVVERLPEGIDAVVDEYEWKVLDEIQSSSSVTSTSADGDATEGSSSGSATPASKNPTFKEQVHSEMEKWLAAHEATRAAPRVRPTPVVASSDTGKGSNVAASTTTQTGKKESAKQVAARAAKAAELEAAKKKK
ncbi:hypothetical protein SmJEL517_g03254 [Synchytrium microbalum]|uniref:Small ribosomal subunit protein uS10 domain-containing protein n=1 Tax=Synchytrium microbalum TaxID=1806994 RepID=A0A507C956_9FUNG|nr:uncharacterized protein SmJEL517_g03254 [Synchytrium microbalum]TPX34073.1 hypothetical protein SmJEL517_g03254 [Synchytrium microbalum]